MIEHLPPSSSRGDAAMPSGVDILDHSKGALADILKQLNDNSIPATRVRRHTAETHSVRARPERSSAVDNRKRDEEAQGRPGKNKSDGDAVHLYPGSQPDVTSSRTYTPPAQEED